MTKKEKQINEEEKRLRRLFQYAPEGQLKAAEGLIQNCAFMRITLNELQAEINSTGTTEEYKHGENQHGIKTAAALQAYNQTMKIYEVTMNKLLKALPVDSGSKTLEEVMRSLIDDETGQK